MNFNLEGALLVGNRYVAFAILQMVIIDYKEKQDTCMYDLPLTLPIGEWQNFDSANTMEIKEVLENITDFETRLSWYNENVRSLASYSIGCAQIYIEWGNNPEQRTKIFCNCSTCRKQSDFNQQHHNIFLEQAVKEIRRIQDAINERKTSYREQLAFLFSVKGFHPDRSPMIEYSSTSGEIYLDLRPDGNIEERNLTEKEQRTIINHFVIDSWNAKYRINGKLNENRKGMNCEKEKEKLRKRLKVSNDEAKKLLVDDCINQIQNLYSAEKESIYKETVYPQFKQHVKTSLKHFGYTDKLFYRLYTGEHVDIGELSLTTSSYSQYVHTKELVHFYMWLIQLKEGKQQDEVEVNDADDNIKGIELLKIKALKLVIEMEKPGGLIANESKDNQWDNLTKLAAFICALDEHEYFRDEKIKSGQPNVHLKAFARIRYNKDISNQLKDKSGKFNEYLIVFKRNIPPLL